MISTIKRLASSILGIGESKVWLDPNAGEKISEALTRDDVRRLIEEGAIRPILRRGVSRHRARKKAIGKRKGRRDGIGSRKGTYKARNNPKQIWMAKVRAQRKLLSTLAGEGRLDKENVRDIYLKIKGNSFRGRQNMLNYLKDNGMLKEPLSKK